VATIYSLNELETLQEKKGDGTSKEEEYHVTTLGIN
jgi:hypothetical protein